MPIQVYYFFSFGLKPKSSLLYIPHLPLPIPQARRSSQTVVPIPQSSPYHFAYLLCFFGGADNSLEDVEERGELSLAELDFAPVVPIVNQKAEFN